MGEHLIEVDRDAPADRLNPYACTRSVTFILPHPPPCPKNQVRIGKGGKFYYPAKVGKSRETIQVLARKAARENGFSLGARFATAEVALKIALLPDQRVAVTVSDCGEPSHRAGYRRRDVQNLAILICDALQGVLYENDRQCVAVLMRRE